MRKSRNNKIDLSIPFDGVEDGCFGKEWNPGCHECNMCHDNPACSIVYYKGFKPVLAKIEEEEKFLDRVDFDLVPWSRLAKEIRNNPNKYSLEDLISKVGDYSRCKDVTMVKYKLKEFILENKFENGFIC